MGQVAVMSAEGARGRGGLRDQQGAVAALNENRIIEASFGSAIQWYGLTPCSPLYKLGYYTGLLSSAFHCSSSVDSPKINSKEVARVAAT